MVRLLMRLPTVSRLRSSRTGEIASKIGVGPEFNWCAERQDIDNKYKLTTGEPLFNKYVQGILPDLRWYQYAYDSILQFKPDF